MSTRYKAPSLKEIVESYEQFRKVSGLKPLGRGHHIYQLLYNSRQLWQGLLTQDNARIAQKRAFHSARTTHLHKR